MAHHIKVLSRPHKNKDGSESKTKKDHLVIDRHRGKKVVVGVATSKKAADEMIEEYRVGVRWTHAVTNPHDHAFLSKHGKRAN
jgi:hypothetical protein